MQGNKDLFISTPAARRCESDGTPVVGLCGYQLFFNNYQFLSLQSPFQVSLEQGTQENFTDVMKTAMRVPVVLKVGSSHIRVTSVSLSSGFLRSLIDI